MISGGQLSLNCIDLIQVPAVERNTVAVLPLGKKKQQLLLGTTMEC